MVQVVRGEWTTDLMRRRSLRHRRSARWYSRCHAASTHPRHAAAGSHRRAGFSHQRCQIRGRFSRCCVVQKACEPGPTAPGPLQVSASRCAVVTAAFRSRRLRVSIALAGKHWLKGSSSRHVLAVGWSGGGVLPPGLAGLLTCGVDSRHTIRRPHAVPASIAAPGSLVVG